MGNRKATQSLLFEYLRWMCLRDNRLIPRINLRRVGPTFKITTNVNWIASVFLLFYFLCQMLIPDRFLDWLVSLRVLIITTRIRWITKGILVWTLIYEVFYWIYQISQVSWLSIWIRLFTDSNWLQWEQNLTHDCCTWAGECWNFIFIFFSGLNVKINCISWFISCFYLSFSWVRKNPVWTGPSVFVTSWEHGIVWPCISVHAARRVRIRGLRLLHALTVFFLTLQSEIRGICEPQVFQQ